MKIENEWITKDEEKAMKKVIESVKELIKTSSKEAETKGLKNVPNSQIRRIHTSLYLNVVRDLTENIKVLESLIDITEEELEKTFTADGTTLDEVEHKLLVASLAGIIH